MTWPGEHSAPLIVVIIIAILGIPTQQSAARDDLVDVVRGCTFRVIVGNDSVGGTGDGSHFVRFTSNALDDVWGVWVQVGGWLVNNVRKCFEFGGRAGREGVNQLPEVSECGFARHPFRT